jgi:hypothetical protein
MGVEVRVRRRYGRTERQQGVEWTAGGECREMKCVVRGGGGGDEVRAKIGEVCG